MMVSGTNHAIFLSIPIGPFLMSPPEIRILIYKTMLMTDQPISNINKPNHEIV